MADASVSPSHKTCITCHETKPIEVFRRKRHQCLVCAAAYARNQYKKNPAKKRANAKKWTNNNLDKVYAAHTQWRRKHPINPEKNYANVLRWQRNNPDKARANFKKYRAGRFNAAINDFTAAQWREMLDVYHHRCVYCGRKMQRLTQDHITPLSKGGNHTKSNIVPACRACNSRKNARPPLVAVQPLLL